MKQYLEERSYIDTKSNCFKKNHSEIHSKKQERQSV